MIDMEIVASQTTLYSRRNFMLTLIGGAITIALQPGKVMAAPAFDRSQLKELRLVAFRALQGERFQLQNKDRESVVELVAIDDQSATWLRPGNSSPQECFLLTFRDLHQRSFTQGSYHFQHGLHGQFELFIVPSPNTAYEYIATINHLFA